MLQLLMDFFNNIQCHRIKLAHLCLADDLLIFSKVDFDSFLGIWSVFTGSMNSLVCSLIQQKVNFFPRGSQKMSWMEFKQLQV